MSGIISKAIKMPPDVVKGEQENSYYTIYNEFYSLHRIHGVFKGYG